MDKVEARLLQAIRTLVSHPEPRVCRHWSACVVLQALEDLGYPPPPELVAAVVDCRDEDTFRIIGAALPEPPA